MGTERLRLVWFGVLGAALLVPLVLGRNKFGMDLAVSSLLYVTLALGLNITVGFAGLLDLGYVAFYAVGAYTYAVLNVHWKVPFVVALPLGGVCAGVAGFFLGSPTLRLRGDYLAIVTLGFAQMTYLVLNNWMSVTKGPNGLIGIERPSLFGFLAVKPGGIFLRSADAQPLFKVQPAVAMYYLALALSLFAIFASVRLNDSRVGRALIAMREDEQAARGMGINVARLKILAFTLAASLAGLAGVLYSAKVNFINPESFTFQESVLILSMVVLGGMGSVPGVVVGALVLYLMPELMRGWLSSDKRMLVFGILMVLMMLFRPQGLWPSATRRRELAEKEA
ncbi:MAG: branched-chain amino acid ABC transporter permease [Acidobacteriota bacterium]